MRITFNEVSIKSTRRWVDSDGKKRQETRKFWQTVSPFNRADDGKPKTREQIVSEITQERDTWLSQRGGVK